ncbi:MAG: hypothetical protein ACLR5S_08200 [Ruminococcus sp.]
MGKSKKIIIGTVAGVTAAAVCVSGVLVWHHHSKSSSETAWHMSCPSGM